MSDQTMGIAVSAMNPARSDRGGCDSIADMTAIAAAMIHIHPTMEIGSHVGSHPNAFARDEPSLGLMVTYENPRQA